MFKENRKSIMNVNYFNDYDLFDEALLNEDTIHVWLLDIRKYNGNFLRLSNVLTAEERYRMSRFIHEGDRRRFLVGHSMLRILLSRYLQNSPENILLSTNEYGKLFLPKSDVFFNISHSENMVMLAFVRKMQIGVDIEKIKYLNDYLQIAKNCFLPEESRRIYSYANEDNSMECFYKIWTIKEAYVKACGDGLSKSLKSFVILEDGTVKDYSNDIVYNYYTKQTCG